MPKYTATDPSTGKSIDLEGDSPPTEQELNQAFSAVHGNQTTQAPDDYWGDVKKNAIEGAKEIPAGATQFVRAASVTNPFQIGQSIFQAARGTPLAQTETGQDVKAAAQTAIGLPKALFQAGKDIGSAAIFPMQEAYRYANNEPLSPSTTYAGQSFRQRPLSFTANVATAALPIAKKMFGGSTAGATSPGETPASPVPSGPAPETPTPETPAPMQPAPHELEVMGGGNLNSTLGLRGNTVSRATPMSANPADTGIAWQKQLQADGVEGQAAQALPKAIEASNKWGKAVGDAWNQIKQANADISKGTPYYDKLQADSVSTLKPILDEANDMIEAGYDPETGTKMKGMYQNLQNAANKNGGQLTVDMVDSEMGRVGKLFKNASRDSDRFAQASELWGKLADIREKMVNDVADASQRPDIAKNLKTANKIYSMYQRVIPDMRARSASAVTGQESMSGFIGAVKRKFLEGPTVNKAIMRAGGALK